MERTDLVLHPNEASDLSPVLDQAGLDRMLWDRAFVTVLDEVHGDECLAVLGHERDAPIGDGWHPIRVPTTAPKGARKTQDAEAIARRDGLLYVLGSQFGKKSGPLQASRAWIGRIAEDDLLTWLADPDAAKPPRFDVVRLRFALHRAVNDALQASSAELVVPGPLTQERYVDATMRAAVKKGKSWADRIRAGDLPVNVEGAGFRADGRLLVGLRYPTTRDGAPLLVELDDADAVIDGADPVCSTVWWLDGLGSVDVPVGIRGIHESGPDRFEAIVGNLDATGKGSTLVEEDARNGAATSTHVAFELPALAAGGPVAARVVHRFETQTRVEGLATHDGHIHYVVDEDGALGLRSLLSEEASEATSPLEAG